MKEQFLHPPDEFSPLPFWFWNDAIDEAGIRRWIAEFQDKGVAGFVIHPRIGIPRDLVYLSDRFLDLVKFAVSEAADRGMQVVLYDEAMYPSGSAHGEVVRLNPAFAARALSCREVSAGSAGFEPGSGIEVPLEPGEMVAAVFYAVADGNSLVPSSLVGLEAGPRVLIPGSLTPPAGGQTAALYCLVEGFSGGTIRGIHFGEDDGEAPPAAADILNAAAVLSFLSLTHDRYYSWLKPWFGSTVIAMFTDEPDVLGRNHRAGGRPWTPGFLEWYRGRGGETLDLLALWHPVGSQDSVRQARYRSAVQARLAEVYYGPLSRWCSGHGIALTGHPHDSSDIGVQKLFHIPGQDIVWRWVAPEDGKALEGEHSTMARCSSDAARMWGRRRNTNECFGCCGPEGLHWALSAGDMKWYLDWLFVRGVNMVMPHAFYYSVDGPRRYGERPPDMGPHNIWWPHYRRIATYIKRLCWLQTDSVEEASVAVLAAPDRLPWRSVAPLYRAQVGFHYVLGEVLAESFPSAYTCLVIEDSVADALSLVAGLAAAVLRFEARGGLVLRTGPGHHAWEDSAVRALDRVEPAVRTVTPCADLRVSRMTKDGQAFVLLVNEGESCLRTRLAVPNAAVTERWDPWTGETTAAGQADRDGFWPLVLERRQSVVLKLEAPGGPEPAVEAVAPDGPSLVRTVSLGPWTVSGLPVGAEPGAPGSDFSLWTGMAGVSTTLTWETEVSLDPGSGLWELDCGRVGEVAQLWVNGQESGVCLWAPYRFSVGGLLVPGVNRFRIEVTNSRSHHYDGRGAFSGLGGPVVLRGPSVS